MLKKVEFYYTQQFLCSSRARKNRPHDIKDAIDLDFREVSNDDFPVAAVYSGKESDGRSFRREYRFLDGKFWREMSHNISSQFLCEFYQHDKSLNCNPMYDDAKENGKLVIVGDNKAEVLVKLEEYAKNYLVCDGAFWKICSEPVIFEYQGQTWMTLKSTSNEWSNYNVNDIDWHNARGYNLEILMPEAFTYGHDDEEITNGVKEYFFKLWPKSYYTSEFAPRLAEKLIPRVVAMVKDSGPKPYIFSDKDVYVAMHEVMDNLEIV